MSIKTRRKIEKNLLLALKVAVGSAFAIFVADDFLGKGYGNQAVEARKSFMKIMVL